MKLNAYAGKTDQGPFLNINEDVFDLDLSHSLFMVIDGFGLGGMGRICAEKIAESIKIEYAKINDDPDSTLSFFYAPQYFLEGNALINAVLLSHQLLYKENQKREHSKRVGAGGIFLSCSERVVSILSVGNCQAYYCSSNTIIKIINEDVIKFDQKAEIDIPLNAFGFYEHLNFTYREVRPSSGDHIVFFTDGVYKFLLEDEIKNTVEKNSGHLYNALEEMFELANARNNLDNQGGFILQF